MKINKKILAAAAIVLPLSVGAGSALAYFTANVEASGTALVAVGPDTTITEDPVTQMTKHITISNGENGGAVYVRVRAFEDSLHTLTYTDTENKWELRNDGYCYYKEVLEPGAKTEPKLDIKIDTKPGAPAQDDFNVVVIYEQIPVEYDSATGLAKPHTPADWEKANRIKTENVEDKDPVPDAAKQTTETP